MARSAIDRAASTARARRLGATARSVTSASWRARDRACSATRPRESRTRAAPPRCSRESPSRGGRCPAVLPWARRRAGRSGRSRACRRYTTLYAAAMGSPFTESHDSSSCVAVLAGKQPRHHRSRGTARSARSRRRPRDLPPSSARQCSSRSTRTPSASSPGVRAVRRSHPSLPAHLSSSRRLRDDDVPARRTELTAGTRPTSRARRCTDTRRSVRRTRRRLVRRAPPRAARPAGPHRSSPASGARPIRRARPRRAPRQSPPPRPARSPSRRGRPRNPSRSRPPRASPVTEQLQPSHGDRPSMHRRPPRKRHETDELSALLDDDDP